MPSGAPSTALKRIGTGPFWENVLTEVKLKILIKKQNAAAVRFEENATELLNDAGEVAAVNIKKIYLKENMKVY